MKRFLVSCWLCMGCMFSAYADSFVGDQAGDVINLYNNSVVYENVNFTPGVVNVNRPIDFINNGIVNTRFVVCDLCDINIINTGNFNAVFELGDDVNIVQVVSSNADFKPIVSNVDYTMLINGADDVVLDGDIGDGGLRKLYIKDSTVDIDDADFSNLVAVYLNGDVVFKYDNLSDLYDKPIIDNVYVDGQISVCDENVNPMYVNVVYVNNNQLFLGRVRETDYSKIFSDNTGVFLNNLRNKNPNDELLYALDNVDSLDSLRGVMKRSVRFNPDLLLRVGQVINEFEKFGFEGDSGAMLKSDFIISDVFYSYGVAANVALNLKDISLVIGARLGGVNYESELDVFDAEYYGGYLAGKFLMDNNFLVRGTVVLNHFDFNLGDVLYNNSIINNPSVETLAGVMDLGYRYNVNDSFYVMPFLGGDFSKYHGRFVDDTQLNVRGGMDIGFQSKVMGMKYSYDFEVGAKGKDLLFAATKIGFVSEYDIFGADAEVRLMRMFDDISCQISISGRVLF